MAEEYKTLREVSLAMAGLRREMRIQSAVTGGMLVVAIAVAGFFYASLNSLVMEVGRVDGRLDGVEYRLSAVEGRLGSVEDRLSRIEAILDDVRRNTMDVSLVGPEDPESPIVQDEQRLRAIVEAVRSRDDISIVQNSAGMVFSPATEDAAAFIEALGVPRDEDGDFVWRGEIDQQEFSPE